MTQRSNGLPHFEVPLRAAMVREIESWAEHPQLAQLRESLHAHSDEHTFLNACAEAVVAKHLLAAGCELEFEVPTPSGKQADFQVSRDGERFFLHIKRLDTGSPTEKLLTISSRLRMLERIERPYIVSIRWKDGATDAQMQQLVTEAAPFIRRASVGDELTVRDENLPRGRREIGAVRIVAPWDGSHVNLTIGLAGFVDEAPRMRKLLRRAYKQFMPRETNVILVCSSNTEDAEDFDTALLGSHIERWDAFPPQGQRVAHGRAEDGFWFNSSHELSRFAGWFRFSLDEITIKPRLWLRDDAAEQDDAPLGLIRELLDSPEQSTEKR